MNCKAYLIFMGSLMLLVGTVFKTSYYYIDIILNIGAFPMFLMVFVYAIWNKKLEENDLNQRLYELSVFIYMIYVISLSLKVFFLNLVIFVIVGLLYRKVDKKNIVKVSTEEESYLAFFQNNKKQLSFRKLILVCGFYYVAFLTLVFKFQGISFKPEFW